MARTVKVTAEKAAKNEPGKLVIKNSIDEKSERAKQKEGPKDKGQEGKAIKNREGGKKGKKEESTERDAGPQRNPKVSKGGRLID